MRRPAPRRVGEALAELSSHLAPATTLASVQAVWADAVGAVIAEEAEVVSERAGVLTVACRSAVWAQELDLLASDLVARLNDLLGGVSEDGPVRSLRVVTGGRNRTFP
jgi:predicted nucleic acid-binding Zn ribbon protein